MLLRTLLALCDVGRAERLARLMRDDEVHVRALPRGQPLWEALAAASCDLLVADEALLPGGGAQAIAAARGLPEQPEVVVLAASAEPAHRAALLAAGAFAVLDPGASSTEVGEALQTLAQRRATQARRDAAAARASEETRLSDLRTASPAMREFLGLVRRVAATDSTLLVLGETGVGKEYLSRAIHAESARRDQPFVAVNCAALSESLLESELFGHVEGAFTGAARARRGYFELAHRSTLFLDEVGELSPKLQVKLLRVIQERRVQPVGGEEEVEIDVRLVAATNRDLQREMAAGRFRPDLYYRLSVVTLEIPPLRRRVEDVPELVRSHVEQFRVRMGRPIAGVREDAMELLVGYAWPGNVRELVNVVERAVLLCEGRWITPADLPEQLRRAWTAAPAPRRVQPPAAADPVPEDASLLDRPLLEARRAVLDAFERRYLERVLTRSNGRVKDAALLAGLNPRSLYEKMQHLGLRKDRFRLG